MNRVFIGVDSRQPVAGNILAHSISKTASKPISITQLHIDQLPIERQGLTEFTYSRYLVPYLCQYEGTALFLDSDMLVVDDIMPLLEADLGDAGVGVVQSIERFEWPSLMLFNCEKCTKLTPEYLKTGKPQSFDWTEKIGNIPPEWNHVVPYSGKNSDAKIIHYTQGIPCFPETEDCEWAGEWREDSRHAMSTVTWDEIMGTSVHKQRMGII